MNISINNLKKSFGDRTVVDIEQFNINKGEILGLVGNNGAGKTTLFRLILDLLKADSGMVTIGDINPAEDENWKTTTGAFIDDSFLIDFLTPEEYFAFIAKVNDITQETLQERLDGLLPLMADEILGQKKLIRDYSAGNKQKIGIISALINNPSLLILDEPFNFLDPSSQNQLKRILTEFNRSTGATVMVSSHNLQHTVEISTRVALLENGKIIEDIDNSDGKAEEILDKYFNV